ncbi:MAG: hypothetical protein AAFW64_09160 [Pseudomonadota bacterium]
MSVMLGLTSPASVYAQTGNECTSIENDIERLQCYDDAFNQIKHSDFSKDDAFSRFSELAFANQLNEGRFYEYAEQDCILTSVVISVEYDRQNAVLVDRPRPQLPVETRLSNGLRVIDEVTYWLLRVDLKEVEQLSKGRTPEFISLSMNRGAEVRYLKANFRIEANGRTRDIWLSLADAENAQSVIHGHVDTISKLIGQSSPGRWTVGPFDARRANMEIPLWILEPGKGQVGGDFYSAKSARGMSWSFARPWPEDSDKIQDALEQLVAACQKEG